MTPSGVSAPGVRRAHDVSVARYDVHGVQLAVRSNDPAVLAHVDDTYGWFATDSAPDDVAPDVDVMLIADPDGGALVVDGQGRRAQLAAADDPLVVLFDAIVGGLIEALTGRGVLVIHAGVVARNGRAIVIAGRSGRGKTTLVLGLVRRGFAFLTDELALILPDDRTVAAYPRGLHVRPAAVVLFPELGFLAGSPAHDLGGGAEWAVRPTALQRAFGATVLETAPVGAIVLLDDEPDPDAPPRLSPASGAIATMELLRGTAAAAWDFDGVLARLPRIVGDVPCVRLRSGRLEDTVDAVLGWADAAWGADR